MKKAFLLIMSAAFVLGIIVTSVNEAWSLNRSIAKDVSLSEIQALSAGEGRLRTVGCGGSRFDLWQPYCCPGIGSCSGGKSCNSTVHGCD